MPLTPPPGLPAYPAQILLAALQPPAGQGPAEPQDWGRTISIQLLTAERTHCVTREQLRRDSSTGRKLRSICSAVVLLPSEFGNSQSAPGIEPLWAGQQATGMEVS